MNSPETSQQEVTEPSIGDSISATYKELEAADKESENVEHEEVEVSAETDEAVSETVESETEEIAEEIEQLAEEVADAEESEYSEPAPERWPDEIKDVYNESPPEVRKAMLDGIYKPMQRSYTQATQEIQQKQNLLNPMLQILNENQGYFERTGQNPAEGLRTHLAWMRHFQEHPEQAMTDWAAQNGQQPTQGGQADSEYLTPPEKAMRGEIAELKQSLNQFTQSAHDQNERQNQQAQAQQQNYMTTEGDKFTNERKDGKLVHPHADKVAPAMGGLIRGGLIPLAYENGQPRPLQEVFEQGYEMACRMDPSIRQVASPGNGQAERAITTQKIGVVTDNPSNVDDMNDQPIGDTIKSVYQQLNRR